MDIKTAMILAGGKGTRFKEKTKDIPKPMIKANGIPLIIYIIEHYMSFGVKNFIILAGYKHENFNDYFIKNSKRLTKNKFIYEGEANIEILYTGLNTMTGWRIKKGIEIVNEDNFFLTYGDGVSDVNLKTLKKTHFSNNTVATQIRKQDRIKIKGEREFKKRDKIFGVIANIKLRVSLGQSLLIKEKKLNSIKNKQ